MYIDDSHAQSQAAFTFPNMQPGWSYLDRVCQAPPALPLIHRPARPATATRPPHLPPPARCRRHHPGQTPPPDPSTGSPPACHPRRPLHARPGHPPGHPPGHHHLPPPLQPSWHPLRRLPRPPPPFVSPRHHLQQAPPWSPSSPGHPPPAPPQAPAPACTADPGRGTSQT